MLAERQDELRQWCRGRRVLRRSWSKARTTASTWATRCSPCGPPRGRWPDLRRLDPDSYFPILGDDLEGFPDKVHLAWEFVTGEGTDDERAVAAPAHLGAGRPGDFDRSPRSLDTGPGRAVGRTGDEPATRTCLFSEGVWTLEEIGPNGIPDLSEAAATWETDAAGRGPPLGPGVDFLPVIHVPNTPASRTHYGQSALAVVAQILDDLGQSDTDLTEVARLVAGPAIALSGPASNRDSTEATGSCRCSRSQCSTSAAGMMDMLDLSVGLEKMMGFGDRLTDRLLVNPVFRRRWSVRSIRSQAPSGSRC